MKQLFKTAMLSVFLCVALSAAGTPKSPRSHTLRLLDTLSYRVFVAADRAGVEHFGGELVYRAKLAELFLRTNEYWNGGSDDFKYYFKFVPELKLVYNGSSKVVERFYQNNFNSEEYDILLVIDSKLDHDDENGGWYCGGARDDLSLVCCRGRSKTEFEDIFDQGYRGVAHEFGHSRGVTDLYADRIRAANNPVNGVLYEPDSCIMNNHHKTDRWSSYAVNIINYTAKARRVGREFPGFFRQMFPENIRIDVTVKGRKKAGVTLNLYGARAKYNDLVPTPYRTYTTDKSGRCLISGVPGLYDKPAPPLHVDDLPYNRWFSFVLEAEYDGVKKYVWLPEYELQQLFFSGEDTYRVKIEL